MRRNPDKRRKGDMRPFEHDPKIALRLTPTHDEPFRWLPRHGQPSCIGEWLTQRGITLLAWLPVYTALVATLVLIVAVFGVPFLGNR